MMPMLIGRVPFPIEVGLGRRDGPLVKDFVFGRGV